MNVDRRIPWVLLSAIFISLIGIYSVRNIEDVKVREVTWKCWGKNRSGAECSVEFTVENYTDRHLDVDLLILGHQKSGGVGKFERLVSTGAQKITSKRIQPRENRHFVENITFSREPSIVQIYATCRDVI